MLNKLSASVKLYLLTFITAASLIALGVYGIYVLEKMNTNTKTLYVDRVLPFQELANVRFLYTTEIIRMAQKVKKQSLTFSQAKDRVLIARETINNNWNNYKRSYLTPEESVLVKQTDSLKTQVDEATDDLLAIISKKDTAGIDALIIKKFSADPAPFTVKLSQLMDLQIKVGKDIFNTNNKIYHGTAKKSLLLILLALFVVLSLSLLITGNIKNLIKDILTSNSIIKESEEKYHSLFEQASDAIFVLNAKGDFTNVNNSMCQLTGYTRDELLTMNIADLLNAELLRINPLNYNKAKTGESVIGERKLINKSGIVVDIEINAKKFADDRIIVIARDITDRKAMEAELIKAELKFRTLADRSMVGVYIAQRGKFVYVNSRFAEVFGYVPDELIGIPPIETIIHPDYQAIANENIRMRATGEASSVHYEAMGKRKDGSTNWIEFYGSRVLLEGEPTTIGSMVDITERYNAEAALKKTEANLQTILNTTDTAYALLDRNLDVLEHNNIALVFARNEFNFDPESGSKFFDHLPEERRAQFLKHIDDVFKGNSISYEVIYDQSGQNIWYHVRMFPISNKENEILGLVLAITDITERKDAEQSLQSAYDRIKTNITFIREMVWKQSHILRSPLANLKGLITMLRNDPGDKEVLGYIETELERMDTVFHEMAKDSSKDEMNY